MVLKSYAFRFILFKFELIMKFDKIHNKGQARLFKNRYLELLSKSHPLLIWGLYLPVIIFMLYKSSGLFETASVVFIFFGGMFSWSLFEYLIHRYAFHFAAKTEKEKKIVYLIHGNHHEYPRDRERLFMPPVPSLIISSIVFGLMFFAGWLLELQEYVLVFFPGFLLGYLLYGTMHYAIHAWNPPFKWMKALWRNHHLHHYKEQEKGFGVSSTLWDLVFRTMFDKNKEKVDDEKVKAQMFIKKMSSKKLQEQ